MDSTLSRRGVLIGGAACTFALCGLAGCASYGPEAEPSGDAHSGDAAAAGLTVPTADIPVGGGKIFDTEKIVVTQPSSGEFKAFSATCTHQGCTVGAVTTTIDCPCHGSAFSISDGSVVQGPATTPLPARTAKVDGANVVVA